MLRKARAAAARMRAVRPGAHHSPRYRMSFNALTERSSTRHLAERLDGLRVGGFVRPFVVAVREDVDEQRRGLFVAERAERLHDRLAGARGAALQRLLEHLVGLVGAHLDDGAQRLALHLRVGVVEHDAQVGQRGVAGEAAQQVDRRAPHRGIA